MNHCNAMKIYANGCSFVLGQELVDNDPLNMDNMLTAFPAQLGAYNDAWSGSSNGAIANRTIEYCVREKPDIAIVGWSHYERILTFEGEFNQRRDRLGQTTIKPKTHENIYLRYFMNDEMLRLDTKHRVEGTYYMLENMGVTPIFFFSFDNVVEVDVPTLWNNKSWNRIYEETFNLNFHDRKQQHPEQKQHDWLAEYLKEYIRGIKKL